MPGLTESVYSIVDLYKFAVDEIGDVPTRLASLVAQVEDAGDLGECEPGLLGCLDKLDPGAR